VTIQMAIGRMIVEKVVGHPNDYSEILVERAQSVIDNLHKWSSDPPKPSYHESKWHKFSQSWERFKAECAKSRIDLPAILQEEK
jgi:hypothetical protein